MSCERKLKKKSWKSGRSSDHGSMFCPRGNHGLLVCFVVLFSRNWQWREAVLQDTVTFFYLLLSFFLSLFHFLKYGIGRARGGRHRASLCLAWFRVSQLFFDVTKLQRRCDICDELVSVWYSLGILYSWWVHLKLFCRLSKCFPSGVH